MKLLRSKPALSGVILSERAIPLRIAKIVGIFALSLCLLFSTSYLAPAFATTASDLADAQARYKDVQAQLDSIAAQYAEISKQQSDTLDQIEAVQKQIDENEILITKRQAELKEHQDELAVFAVDTYKQDQNQFLDVLLESESFENFVSNLEFISLINDKKLELISETRAIKNELESKTAQLQKDKAELEKLRVEQAEQMAAMQAQQAQVASILAGLDDEVKALTEKNNAELAARAAESAYSGGGGWSTPAELVVTGSGSASAVISECYSTPSPGLNWCAAWVSNVFSNAGMGFYSGNACDMYNRYCYSSDLGELQPGMIVAVSSNPRGGSAGTIYGHVGIYIGNGIVMENIGYIAQTPINEWISWYSSAVTPRWGWMGGVVLS